MTQEFVAETIGVSRQSVSKWESGVSDPNTSNLIALAKLYKVSPEDLLERIEAIEEKQKRIPTLDGWQGPEIEVGIFIF